MKWVKVTRTSGETVYVNIKRFDIIERSFDDDEKEYTAVTMLSGDGESDSVNVREPALGALAVIMPEGEMK
jgi:hypothetical protein